MTNNSAGIFCSIIIPTIGRKTLVRAVESVRDQAFDSAAIEIIVVNDSGVPLESEILQHLDGIFVINTNRRERSVARNSGAAIAQGEYLWFLDDDDWLLPGALQSFWETRQRAGIAAWIYGGIQIVDQDRQVFAERNSGLQGNCAAQILGGAWAPIQASMIHAATFFEVGGYDPAICGTEDEDLCRRVAVAGDFANVGTPVACLFRGAGWNTSTDYLRATADTRRSRDRILNQTAVFRRLSMSLNGAKARSYWKGRILKVGASSVAVQLRRRSASKALSRMVFMLRWLGASGLDCFTTNFWQGFKADHVPDSLHFVHQSLERASMRKI